MKIWLDELFVSNPGLSEGIAKRLGETLDGGKEQDVHAFFEEEPLAFECVCPNGLMVSKMPLGTSYITDFVFVMADPYSNDPTPVVILVEIERPDLVLFTKAGDPASGLTHAIRQVQNWKRWLLSNRAFFLEELRRALESTSPEHENHFQTQSRLIRNLSLGTHERYMVIGGRRQLLSQEDRVLLGQMNQDFQGIVVITYDVILDALRRSQSLRGGRSVQVNGK